MLCILPFPPFPPFPPPLSPLKLVITYLGEELHPSFLFSYVLLLFCFVFCVAYHITQSYHIIVFLFFLHFIIQVKVHAFARSRTENLRLLD